MVEIYKVGGAVRDQLLGITPVDIDYVVVGANKEYMRLNGFMEVGRDFPVYLHPTTYEEYALARRERKSGLGHQAFTFEANEDVSLIDDLKRRDITINAMALDSHGNLIDPFGGKKDLEQQIIRHVSPSFSEDPLRVLRVARFSARFNFTVAPETLLLMENIVASKEILTISHERINNEIARALFAPYAINFFAVLIQIKALEQILPNLAKHLKDDKLQHEFNSMLTKLEPYNFNLDERFTLIGFYMQKADLFTKKAQRLTQVLLKALTSVQNLNTIPAQNILNIINCIDPSRRFPDYLSIKNILTLLSDLRDDATLKKNLQTLDYIIIEFKKINYTTIIQQTNFVEAIKQLKLSIINSILKKVE